MTQIRDAMMFEYGSWGVKQAIKAMSDNMLLRLGAEAIKSVKIERRFNDKQVFILMTGTKEDCFISN
jgi:hypothetical protein